MTAVYSQRLLLLIVLLVMLPACSSADTLSTRDVRVTLTEFSIQASSQRFTPGVPYRLVATNRGQVTSEGPSARGPSKQYNVYYVK